ncbi:helix-loop-helix protein 11-like [Artemia franciscana]
MSIFLLDSPAGYVSLEAVTKDSQDEDDDDLVSHQRFTFPNSNGEISTHRDQDRRKRRDIANSNERRRMQNINAGFASLRALLPIQETEKMSKATVLQHATEYICQLEQDKEKLSNQIVMLKAIFSGENDEGPNEKKFKLDGVEDLYDIGLINAMTTSDLEPSTSRPITGAARRIIDDLRKRIVELRTQYEAEKKLRVAVENEKRTLELQMFELQRMTLPITTENGDSLELTYQVVDGLNDRETLEVSAEDESLSTPITISLPSPRVAENDVTTKFLLNTEKINGSLLEAAILSDKVEVELTSVSPSSCSNNLKERVFTSGRKTNNTAIKRKAPRTPSFCDSNRDRFSRTTSSHDVVDAGMNHPFDRSFLAEASRQNLETIVEAIRHLEGDHLFETDKNKESLIDRGMYKLDTASELEDSPRYNISNSEGILESEAHEDIPPPEPMDSLTLAETAHFGKDEPINLEFRPSLSDHEKNRRPGVIVVKTFGV